MGTSFVNRWSKEEAARGIKLSKNSQNVSNTLIKHGVIILSKYVKSIRMGD